MVTESSLQYRAYSLLPFERSPIDLFAYVSFRQEYCQCIFVSAERNQTIEEIYTTTKTMMTASSLWLHNKTRNRRAEKKELSNAFSSDRILHISSISYQFNSSEKDLHKIYTRLRISFNWYTFIANICASNMFMMEIESITAVEAARNESNNTEYQILNSNLDSNAIASIGFY